MKEIVAVDVGGTHARFAIAEIAGGRVAALGPETVLGTADYPDLPGAWRAYAERIGRALPDDAAIALAGPVDGRCLSFANSRWIIEPAALSAQLGVRQAYLVNDFAAVAHAVAQLGQAHLRHLCGPDVPLPGHGITSIIGPGTGLGVAALSHQPGTYQVFPSEAGHIAFAPLDEVDEQIVRYLRRRLARVSVERIVSGPGLGEIHAALGGSGDYGDNRELWAAALADRDDAAAAALERFCLALGAFAGDIALGHGAGGVVISGQLASRLEPWLARSGFHGRFIDKGRFREWMSALPVKLLIHPQPGLYGAAAAFAQLSGG